MGNTSGAGEELLDLVIFLKQKGKKRKKRNAEVKNSRFEYLIGPGDRSALSSCSQKMRGLKPDRNPWVRVSGSTLRIGSRHFSQSVFLHVKWPARNLSICTLDCNYSPCARCKKMAQVRCCGREALVHKWRTRKKEKAVHTTCQIVTLREKLKVMTVLKDVLRVFISLGVVHFEFLDAVSRRYGKKHEEVDRHWNSWLSTIGRLPWKQDFDSKIGDPRTMGKLSGTCFFLVNLFLHLGPVECSQSFCWVVWVLKMLPDI